MHNEGVVLSGEVIAFPSCTFNKNLYCLLHLYFQAFLNRRFHVLAYFTRLLCSKCSGRGVSHNRMGGNLSEFHSVAKHISSMMGLLHLDDYLQFPFFSARLSLTPVGRRSLCHLWGCQRLERCNPVERGSMNLLRHSLTFQTVCCPAWCPIWLPTMGASRPLTLG